MDELGPLRELLTDETPAPVEHTAGHRNSVTLVERMSHHYALRITGVPKDAVAFKTDAFPTPKPLFKNSRGECKRADYVIVTRKGSKRRIIYVEMKGTKASQTRHRMPVKGR